MAIQKPLFLAPDFENIPGELKDVARWVCWKAVYVTEKDKWTKVPFQSKIGVMGQKRTAKSTDPRTWSDFETALMAYQTGLFDGIGFVLTNEDSIAGLDFDHCRNPGTGEISSDVKGYIHRIDSYTEVSPSGTGIRIFVRAKLPPHGRKKGNIEIYESVRYLTITGQCVEGTPANIEDRQKETTVLHSEVFGSQKTSECQMSPVNIDVSPNDRGLLDKAFSSKNGGAIKKLYAGDRSAYESWSEADLALCAYLAFWCGPDKERIDRLFRSSGLYRDKWSKRHYADGRTYGEGNLQKVINSANNFYDSTFYKSYQVPANNGNKQLLVASADDIDNNVELYTDPIRRSVVSVGDFLKMDIPPRPFLLHPWLRPGTLALISAPRGIGKTWLCLSIFLSVAGGVSLGKWKAENPAGCLYLDGEMSSDEIQERLKKLSKGIHLSAPADLLTSELMQNKGFPTPNLNDPLWRESIFEFIKESGRYEVIFLDNLSSLTPGIDENAKQDWDPINQWLLRIRHQGVAVILVHHMAKSGDQRGTSAREDNIDVSIRLTRPRGYKAVEGAVFDIEFTKARSVHGSGIVPFGLKLIDIGGKLEWTTLSQANENKSRIVVMLAQGLSQKDVAKEARCTPGYVSQVRKEAIDKKWLTTENKLTDDGVQHFGIADESDCV